MKFSIKDICRDLNGHIFFEKSFWKRNKVIIKDYATRTLWCLSQYPPLSHKVDLLQIKYNLYRVGHPPREKGVYRYKHRIMYM